MNKVIKNSIVAGLCAVAFATAAEGMCSSGYCSVNRTPPTPAQTRITFKERTQKDAFRCLESMIRRPFRCQVALEKFSARSWLKHSEELQNGLGIIADTIESIVNSAVLAQPKDENTDKIAPKTIQLTNEELTGLLNGLLGALEETSTQMDVFQEGENGEEVKRVVETRLSVKYAEFYNGVENLYKKHSDTAPSPKQSELEEEPVVSQEETTPEQPQLVVAPAPAPIATNDEQPEPTQATPSNQPGENQITLLQEQIAQLQEQVEQLRQNNQSTNPIENNGQE